MFNPITPTMVSSKARDLFKKHSKTPEPFGTVEWAQNGKMESLKAPSPLSHLEPELQ